ncbi:hypothetical protein PSH77_14205 [Pseudomonas extremorientalis]|nr:hypothetical protein [Pseudomonas extremorientalis]WLG59637.1 hypothetical protein PSH77_14205 [Pseudomonas extremorientalis]
MRAIAYHGPRDVSVENVPNTKIEKHSHVLVPVLHPST